MTYIATIACINIVVAAIFFVIGCIWSNAPHWRAKYVLAETRRRELLTRIERQQAANAQRKTEARARRLERMAASEIKYPSK